MITLKASNNELTKNAKFSYLNDNYDSGESSIVVTNSTGFAADDYILLGEFGSESTEVVQISSVTSASNTLNLSSSTDFAHSQDTKVTIIKYNQVKFYHTSTATFSDSDSVTGYIDIQPDSFYTKAYDTSNTTGYGWFSFYNSTSSTITSNSNAIPYAGFGENSVRKIFESFFSLLNNKELKLVSNDDAFRWLNEAYAIAQNHLNLVNPSYKVAAEYSFTTTSSTQEYSLPTDFSNIISITDDEGTKIEKINLADVPKNDDDKGYSSSSVKYFLRSSYIGFSPVPTAADTFYMYYQKKSDTLDSYYDNIVLPDNNFYFLVDGMLARASIKLPRFSRKTHEDKFIQGINNMKITAHKQDESLESWDIADKANI